MREIFYFLLSSTEQLQGEFVLCIQLNKLLLHFLERCSGSVCCTMAFGGIGLVNGREKGGWQVSGCRRCCKWQRLIEGGGFVDGASIRVLAV